MPIFRCDLCQKIFYSNVNWKNHADSEHEDEEATYSELRYQCPDCDMVFGHWTDVDNHALREHKHQKAEPIVEVVASGISKDKVVSKANSVDEEED